MTKMKMSLEPVDVSKIAADIFERLRRSDPERVVETVIGAGISMVADNRLMEIAMENLIGNAWKFTGKTPHARIEFGTNRHDGQDVCFVKDNGVGFDMAYAQNLFGPFQRLHTMEEFPGTGIGLSIVQRIIHRLDGRIWAEAAINKGATFYFVI